ncbi:MAG: hypothetical protein ACPGU4_03850 [Flavobacteriales bacterium]
MKNLTLICTAVLLTLSSAFAQDKLTFLDGAEQEVKILEVSSSEVKYKRLNNLEGPTFSTLKSELFMITYANGDKDVIKQAPKAETEITSKPESEEEPSLDGEVKNPIHHKKFGNSKEEQLKLCKAKNRQGIALTAIGAGLFYPVAVVNFVFLPGTTGSRRAIHLMWGIGGIAAGTAMITVGAVRLAIYGNHKRKLINGLAIAPTIMNMDSFHQASVKSQAGYGISLSYKF